MFFNNTSPMGPLPFPWTQPCVLSLALSLPLPLLLFLSVFLSFCLPVLLAYLPACFLIIPLCSISAVQMHIVGPSTGVTTTYQRPCPKEK